MPFDESQAYWDADPSGRYAFWDTGGLDGRIRRRKLSDRGVFSRFRAYPCPSLKVLAAGTLNATGGGAATGAAGDENRLQIGDTYFEYHILGTQTILFPQPAAGGLDIGMDQTNNEGVEITNGIEPGAFPAFVIGTDPAFFFRCRFSIEDVSGSDVTIIGFRKQEAYQAAHTGYADYAAIGNISGDVKLLTEVNGGGTTTTDTTDNWADGETHELCVFVSASGVVTCTIDGRAPTATAAFTFDDGDTVIPYLYFIHDSDVAGAVLLKEWECDFQDPLWAARR